MRLGLESTRDCVQTSAVRPETVISSRPSACSPIVVDDDDALDSTVDDTNPQFARAHHVIDRPSLPIFSVKNEFNGRINSNKTNETANGTRQKEQPLQFKSTSERSYKHDTKGVSTTKSPELLPSQHHFNLLFSMNTDAARTQKQHREDRAIIFRSSRNYSPQTTTERQNVIVATRTSICGERFDRSELEFRRDRVQVTIWKRDERQWQGDVKFVHIRRFCFSQADGPPFILLLQLDNANGRSSFAHFYDPFFAKVWKEHGTKEQAALRMYGVVFYFDAAIDYMRCQSMADGNSSLSHFFSEKLSEDERRTYLSLDASKLLRHRHNIEVNGSIPTDSRSQSFAELVGKGAKQAFGSMTSFFRPVARSSVLEEDDSVSDFRGRVGHSQSRMLHLLQRNNEVCSPHLDEEKLSVPVDVYGTDKRDRGPGVDNSDALAARDVFGSEQTSITGLSSCLQQDKTQGKNVEGKTREAESCRETERVKRRRIENRRNEVLLEYPYDGSDALGKIRVTLGDVDRLLPGEFLNDNLIDFYLRFLWRHLDSLQQQQMYFFTSHFFSQLNGTNGAHELSTAAPDERFARVARWTQKETNLFDKRFLFIPINDSFHWSIAIICNPGSTIIKKYHKVKRCPRGSREAPNLGQERSLVDLVNGGDGISVGREREGVGSTDYSKFTSEFVEEEIESCQADRLAYPPCLLFLDSLRCHRKKKFTKMLRNYLECEYKTRFASSSTDAISQKGSMVGADIYNEQDTVITVFDSDSIVLHEPSIPLQTNSSDCGVFLLMYAVLVVRLFPFGVTRADLESNMVSTLTSNMFREEHVLEFREYLQQVLFCLQFLEKHGRPEQSIKDEGLESFAIE